MLVFVRDWLGDTESQALALSASLARFVDCDGYDVAQLRADLARFAFLLGNDNSKQVFSHLGDL